MILALQALPVTASVPLAWLMHTALVLLLRSAVEVTLVAAAACGGDRLLQRAGARARHRLWVAALLLCVLLPALPSGGWIRIGTPPDTASSHSSVTYVLRLTTTVGLPALPSIMATLLALLFLLLLAAACTRLVRRWWLTQRLLDSAVAQPLDPATAHLLARAATDAGVDVPRVLAAGRSRRPMLGPVTFGWWRPVLLVPARFFDTERAPEVTAALAHECAHIARRDYAKNLFYEIVTVAVAYHPALWLVRRRVAETREVVCDGMAAATLRDRNRYAASLISLASTMAGGPVAAPSQAIGIFDANILDTNILEERIMRLTTTLPTLALPKRLGLTALATALLLGGGATALALAGSTDPAAPQTPQHVYKIGDGVTPPVLVYSVDAEFPKSQRHKKGKFEGIAVVGTTVDASGMPTDIHITKSLAPDFDECAMDAVRQFRFKPSLLDGKPVAVAVTIEVHFKRF